MSLTLKFPPASNADWPGRPSACQLAPLNVGLKPTCFCRAAMGPEGALALPGLYVAGSHSEPSAVFLPGSSLLRARLFAGLAGLGRRQVVGWGVCQQPSPPPPCRLSRPCAIPSPRLSLSPQPEKGEAGLTRVAAVSTPKAHLALNRGAMCLRGFAADKQSPLSGHWLSRSMQPPQA